MSCQILLYKPTGEEFLAPGCASVAHNLYLDMPDRELIKEYCTCNRKKREKYEQHTRDEVFIMIEKLEEGIMRHEQELLKIKNEVDCLKSEVFMLNTVEVFSNTINTK